MSNIININNIDKILSSPERTKVILKLINKEYDKFKQIYPNEQPFWKIKCYKYKPKTIQQLEEEKDKSIKEILKEKNLENYKFIGDDYKNLNTSKPIPNLKKIEVKTTSLVKKHPKTHKESAIEQKFEIFEKNDINQYEVLNIDVGDIEVNLDIEDINFEDIKYVGATNREKINVNQLSIQDFDAIIKKHNSEIENKLKEEQLKTLKMTNQKEAIIERIKKCGSIDKRLKVLLEEKTPLIEIEEYIITNWCNLKMKSHEKKVNNQNKNKKDKNDKKVNINNTIKDKKISKETIKDILIMENQMFLKKSEIMINNDESDYESDYEERDYYIYD